MLVHTCDAYARFWGGWSAHFAAHWRGPSCWPVRFANEFVDPAEAVPLLRCAGDGGGPVAHHAPTGGGPFSSRLDVALRAVPTPLVMYMQEDVWLTGETAAIGEALACAARLVRDGLWFLTDNDTRCDASFDPHEGGCNRWCSPVKSCLPGHACEYIPSCNSFRVGNGSTWHQVAKDRCIRRMANLLSGECIVASLHTGALYLPTCHSEVPLSQAPRTDVDASAELSDREKDM